MYKTFEAFSGGVRCQGRRVIGGFEGSLSQKRIPLGCFVEDLVDFAESVDVHYPLMRREPADVRTLVGMASSGWSVSGGWDEVS